MENILKFFQDDKIVNINGKEFDLELFLLLEKNYPYRPGWKRTYIPNEVNEWVGDTESYSGPLKWQQGDLFLTKVNDLVYLKAYLNSEE